MGRLIVRGWVKRDRVEDLLMRACKAIGLIDDPDDGPAKCEATIASGIKAGMKQPYHDIRWKVAGEAKRDGRNAKAADGG
jgi:hypothetical protein